MRIFGVTNSMKDLGKRLTAMKDLTNTLIIQQDNTTGNYSIVNGHLPENTSRIEFRNGRWFGLHSDNWVNCEVNEKTAHHGYNTPGCNTPKVFIDLKTNFDNRGNYDAILI